MHFKEKETIYLNSLGIGVFLNFLMNINNIAIKSAIHCSVKEDCVNDADVPIAYRIIIPKGIYVKIFSGLLKKR